MCLFLVHYISVNLIGNLVSNDFIVKKGRHEKQILFWRVIDISRIDFLIFGVQYFRNLRFCIHNINLSVPIGNEIVAFAVLSNSIG